MKNEYEFKCDVGQVVSGDSHSNAAQSHVDIHVHFKNGAMTIGKRQRSAIASKVHEIQEKIGVDKSEVSRCLKSRFAFDDMDEISRRKFQKVMSYLDEWLGSGIAMPPDSAVSHPTQNVRCHKSYSFDPDDEFSGGKSAVCGPLVPEIMPRPKAVSGFMRQSPRLLLGLVAIAVGVIVSGIHAAMHLSPGEVAGAAGVEPIKCEYGGHDYSIGSELMQADIKKMCVASVLHKVEWQVLPVRD